MNSLTELFSAEGLMPHGFRYQWKPGLVWLHGVSDILIALAYVAISVALIHFMRRRRDIPFGWMFVCFGVFIAACGGTHFMELWTLWVPSYWFAGGVKALTAVASVTCTPRDRAVSPLMSAVSVLTPSLLLSPPIS